MRRWIIVAVWSCLFIISDVSVAGNTSAVSAGWKEPNWEMKYDATQGVLPPKATPNWKNYYKHETASIVVDDISKQKVLLLDHTGDGSYEHQYYALKSKQPEAIHIGTKTTVEFKFRLMDPDESRLQLTFQIICPTSQEGKLFSYLLRFSREGFVYSTKSGYPEHKCDIGNTWHTVRMVIDTERDLTDVYIDKTLMLNGMKGVVSRAGTTCGIKFGDGSGWVKGKAELSYIRWTSSELVPPLTTASANSDKK